MKRIMIVLLGTLLVLGIAGSAFAAHLTMYSDDAQVRIGGDFRVRGMHKDNATDADGDIDDTKQVYDQRFRMTLDAVLPTGVEVRTRLHLSDGMWGMSATDGDSTDTGSVTMDWAYLYIPYKGAKLFIGRQEVSWGNKLMSWGNEAERIKVTYPMGSGVIGGFIQKSTEVNAGDADGDLDAYSLFATTKFDGGSAAAIGVYEMDNAEVNDKDGFTVDVAADFKTGVVSLAGELTLKSGDKYETTVDDGADLGAFIHAAMPVDAMTLHAALAYAGEGFTADDDFTPTLLFGTSQPTGIMQWGAPAEDTAFAGVLMVDYKVSDATMVGGKLAYATWDKTGWGGNGSDIIEVDLFMSHDLSAKTNYWLGLAYGIPSDMSDPDDSIISLAHKIEIKI